MARDGSAPDDAAREAVPVEAGPREAPPEPDFGGLRSGPMNHWKVQERRS